MRHITIELDETTCAALEQVAATAGISASNWLENAVRQQLGHVWPADCIALAGRFVDFPGAEGKLTFLPTDTSRI